MDPKLRDRLIKAILFVTKKNYLWSDKRELFDELPSSLKSEIAR